jgi:hypothetical protein
MDLQVYNAGVMGDLRFDLTFFGGKADEHRVLADRLAELLKNMGEDLVEVCRLISTEDLNVDFRKIEKECKLYVIGDPKPSTLTVTVGAPEATTEWVRMAGDVWTESLSSLYVIPGTDADDTLPRGINRSILEHAVDYATPLRGEYEGIKLTVAANGQPERNVVFDDRLKRAAQRRLANLTPDTPVTIHGHTIQGVLYGVEDQQYENPDSDILVEVDIGEGTRWVCRLKKSLIPDNIEQYWEKRVVLTGLATFRPRRPLLVAEYFEILGDKPDIDEAIQRFIEVGGPAWKKGPKLRTYMKDVRER